MQVAALWRFPVKSMQGEAVDSIDVGAVGVSGDRAFAVAAADSGLLLSAKREPRLLEATAVTDGDQVRIDLPDGSSFGVGSPDASDRLSAWLGREVALVALPDRLEGASFDMTLDPPNDDAEVYEIPTPPGTFLDIAAVHLLTESSLASIAASAPQLQWDIRRFRPNVLVSGAGDGYPEDAWVGGEVAIGDEVRLGVMMRTMRCAMPLRAQPAGRHGGPLDRSTEIYRALQAGHSNDLGAYCSIASPGRVAVGDEVRPV